MFITGIEESTLGHGSVRIGRNAGRKIHGNGRAVLSEARIVRHCRRTIDSRETRESVGASGRRKGDRFIRENDIAPFDCDSADVNCPM